MPFLMDLQIIEFVNRDENIDYDTKMKELQAELSTLLKHEEDSRKDLKDLFNNLGFPINS